MNEDGKSGTMVVVRRNVQSDAEDPQQQERDFDELMSNWRGDKHLLDQMEKGLYIKERKLSLEKGTLVWRETSLFSDVSKLFPGFDVNDSLRIPLKDTTGSVIATNGILVVRKDSSGVVWPPHTKVFELARTSREFKPKSNFAEWFRKTVKDRR